MRDLAVAHNGPILAISPHLDDVALSAGASVAVIAMHQHVSVLTVFAGDPSPELSPVAIRHHDRCGLDENAVALRRAEDVRAAAILGVDTIHADIPEAVYRRRPSGAWVCIAEEDIVGPPPFDPELDRRLQKLTEETIAAVGATLLLGPLGIGSHVDHVLTHRAVVRAARASRIPALLWHDEPYTSWSPAGVHGGPCSGVHQPYDTISLEKKLQAIEAYASQIGMLWPFGQDWRAAVSNFGTNCHRSAGETFDRVPLPSPGKTGPDMP